MPNTYTLISSNVLASSAASVTFSAIPSTYTDLVVRMSAKHGGAGALSTMTMSFNGNTSSVYSYTAVYAAGSSFGNYRASDATNLSDILWTSSNFNNTEIYIPSYTASQNKPINIFGVEEQNSTTTNQIDISASLFRSTAAITSIALSVGGGGFSAGSSFYLYGIKNS